MRDLTSKPDAAGRWAVLSDRLAIAGAVGLVLLLFFLLIDGAVMNFDCSFSEFITFQCNRWSAMGGG